MHGIRSSYPAILTWIRNQEEHNACRAVVVDGCTSDNNYHSPCMQGFSRGKGAGQEMVFPL